MALLSREKEGGAAAILTNTHKRKTTYELLAEHIITHGPPQAIAVFSDSQTALKSTTLPKRKTPGQHLATQIFNNFKRWSQHFAMRLYWCPGHTGIQQNEEVDKLAKEEALSETSTHHTLHHISIS
ncbi:hypothetical protein O181_061921 [Austropuccinia psidii MF-1]|uniref:RNase H type-1 domain-containing protein n=1 Tax=Austropuccinia psidii MF-1 TaxID=1389203 RepID=A0A9Q3HY07_9BASI|nr:hypothetical protein [Austropuccinia psidii MF-1]